MKKVLVLNRGEIASRIIKTLNENGIESVSFYTKDDKGLPFIEESTHSYLLDKHQFAYKNYLDIDYLIEKILNLNIDTVHPGYGFLSENSEFVKRLEENGIDFIGPSSEEINFFGDKIITKNTSEKFNINTLPMFSYEEVKQKLKNNGSSFIMKPKFGGGGKGIRIIESLDNFDNTIREAELESKSNFNTSELYFEKFIKNSTHIEIQIVADNYGNVIHLYERDSSFQKNYQKIIEFAPSVGIKQEVLDVMYESAKKIIKGINYHGIATVEFLIDKDTDEFYLMEVNPRLQVEHTVTEEITGIDIVNLQINILKDKNLKELDLFPQNKIKKNGYAVENRITSVDPENNFSPVIGTPTKLYFPKEKGTRIDGWGIKEGKKNSVFFDSLIVKVISHDKTFESSKNKSIQYLKKVKIEGIKTNIDFLINSISKYF